MSDEMRWGRLSTGDPSREGGEREREGERGKKRASPADSKEIAWSVVRSFIGTDLALGCGGGGSGTAREEVSPAQILHYM